MIQSTANVHRLLLEVIVQNVADASAAAEGGADRLEVVRAIDVGGLTPSPELVRAIAAETDLPLRVMIRENGGYGTDAREIVVMRRAALECASAGAEGLVIGFAKNGAAAVDDTAAILDVVPAVRATFHRAFDRVGDPLVTIDRLRAMPQIDGILTDGGAGTPAERCKRLGQYQERAGNAITIVAGGGVDEEALAWFARHGCVHAVHVGRAAREGRRQDGPVSAERVGRLRKLAG